MKTLGSLKPLQINNGRISKIYGGGDTVLNNNVVTLTSLDERPINASDYNNKTVGGNTSSTTVKATDCKNISPTTVVCTATIRVPEER